MTIHADDEPGDEETGDEETDDDQYSDDESADLEADLMAALHGFDTDDQEPSEEDSDREGSDASSAAGEDSFQPTNAERRRLRPLEGQNTSYHPTITRIKLPKRNGGMSWRRHYEELLSLLDEALEREYWHNLEDPTAAQAVSQIAAEVEALAPAAKAVRDGKRAYMLGFGDVGGIFAAKSVVAHFFKYIRPLVEAIPRFEWRSQSDYAVGILHYDDTRSKGVGAFKGYVGVI